MPSMRYNFGGDRKNESHKFKDKWKELKKKILRRLNPTQNKYAHNINLGSKRALYE